MRTSLLVTLPLISAACGTKPKPIDAEPYDTLQLCYDDHHLVEGVGVQDSIKICCIDHPIGTPPVGPNVVCGESAAACVTYVDANLDGQTVLADIQQACTDYIIDRAK